MNKKIEFKSYAYALKNAISYGGKANVGSIISSLFHEGFSKEEIKKNSKLISEIVEKVNSLSKENQKKEFENLKEEVGHRKERVGLPELPNNKKVIMRFAPSPSGPLHIGHAIASSYSYVYTQKYNGKF